MYPVLLLLSPKSRPLAERICEVLPDAQIHVCQKNIIPLSQRFFTQNHPIIGLCSSGILIRALAPVLREKWEDPPVVAVASDGRTVVPLLGVHRGGHTLARRIASCLGVTAAFTTSSDTGDREVTLDSPAEGWVLKDREKVKDFMVLLRDGVQVRVEGGVPQWLENLGLHFSESAVHTIRFTVKAERETDSRTLVYHPQRLALGIGCERGVSEEEVLSLISQIFESYGLAYESLAVMTSIDLKVNESALYGVSERLGVPLRFFSAQTLEGYASSLANPSEEVFRVVGCHGVAEGAALAAVGVGGFLRVPKQKFGRVTCALAESLHPIVAQSIGRGRGSLTVMGLGPGRDDWHVQEIYTYLYRATDIVGYTFYLESLVSLRLAATFHPFPIGKEVERVVYALELALGGRDVVLVSSGDSGIYGMASLVFEVLEDRVSLQDMIDIRVCPGVSAMQGLASYVGAPLGHDFCVVSLSDILSTWEGIECRVLLALEGDFVLVLYNPASRRRSWQIGRVQELVRRYRGGDTPVMIGRNIGRVGEEVFLTRLETFTDTRIDMFTVLIIGNTKTRLFTTPNGKTWVYTPRGYRE